MSTDIPYHLSERVFRKFERVIANAIVKCPKVVILDYKDSGYSANTYAARLRDALASYRTYRWMSKIISDSTLTFEIVKTLKVSFKNGVIRVGPFDALKAEPIGTIEPKSPTTIAPIAVSGYLSPNVQIICHLASLRVLTQPIPVLGLNDNDVVWLMDNFDVTITKQTNDIYLIQ